MSDHQGERWQTHKGSAAESRLHYRSDEERDWPEDTSARRPACRPAEGGHAPTNAWCQVSCVHKTDHCLSRNLCISWKKNKKKTISVIWHEGIGGRSATEITSAYAVALEKECDIKHIVY